MARPSLAACTAPVGGLQPTLYTANRGGFASRFRVRPVLVVVLRLLILLQTTTGFTNCSSCSTLVSMASVLCVLRVSRRGLPPDATAACLLLFVVSPPSHPFHLINWRHRRHVLFLHGHVTVPFCGVCRHFSQPLFAALHLFWQLCCSPRTSTCLCSSVSSSAARRAAVLALAVPLPAVQWRLLTRLGP